MAEVSVVVVTFNAQPWLERCPDSVAEYETIVVDNGSTDGTSSLFATGIPRPSWSSKGSALRPAGSRGIELASGRFAATR